MTLIDFLYFFSSAEYGEDEEDIEMAPTPKQRKLCSRLDLNRLYARLNNVIRIETAKLIMQES